jgi:hypothetical protein
MARSIPPRNCSPLPPAARNGSLTRSMKMRRPLRYEIPFGYRSPGHRVDGGSLAEIFVVRNATR